MKTLVPILIGQTSEAIQVINKMLDISEEGYPQDKMYSIRRKTIWIF